MISTEDHIHNAVLRPIWRRFFYFNWKLGFFLVFVVCIPRFILVLDANVSGNYGLIGAVMVISALAPFIFLSKPGRIRIGLVRTNKYRWTILAFICGVLASLILFYIGRVLYGHSNENWYVYIAKSYKIPSGIAETDKKVMFFIMAVTGMTFSPIGEELFFRGIVQSSFAASFGEKRALIIDSLAFSLTHIAHFGLVFINQGFTLYAAPTLIWVLSMFLLSMVFYFFKKRSGSLISALICHAGFNLGMIFSIFYLL